MKERAEAEGVPFVEHFCFHYLNADGERTIRTVRSTHVLYLPADVYVVGYCELRKEKRVFRGSRIMQAYLLGTGFSSTSFPAWILNKVPNYRINQSKKEQLVRETRSGYLAIQTSQGLVHLSSQVYSKTFEESSLLQEAEAVHVLLKNLPALAQDLAVEIVQKFEKASAMSARANCSTSIDFACPSIQ